MVKKGKFRVYLSHPIRGAKKERATEDDIYKNCMVAQDVAIEMGAYFNDWNKMDGLPPVDIYCPAEHDEFVQLAFDKKLLTIDNILEIDCDIIKQCDMLICYGMVSSGMMTELEFAEKNNIPILAITHWDNSIATNLREVYRIIIEAEKKQEGDNHEQDSTM